MTDDRYPTDQHVWRDPIERDGRKVPERVVLTERVIDLERRNRLLEDELRRRVQDEERHLAGHPEGAALMARVRELEGIVARQNDIITRGRRRAS